MATLFKERGIVKEGKMVSLKNLYYKMDETYFIAHFQEAQPHETPMKDLRLQG